MPAASRRQNKVTCNLTLLPETIAWLKKGGNASARVDEMVGKILKGDLVHQNTLNKLQNQLDIAIVKIRELEAKVNENKNK